MVDTQREGLGDPQVWFAGLTSEQDLVPLNEPDGRDHQSMIALFNEEVVGGVSV